MKVTYFITTGTPCEIPSGVSGVTLKEALADFQNYIDDCKRIGNEYNNASMSVSCDKWSERLYEIGPKGGITRNKFY